ncbi:MULTISPECIES: XdhC family protein [Paenibacillus]|uniref:XdhC Rossmann domain-containing protein n=1 Tax=Paenibacillus naphthalenovorans TaxID=162209 RepID=A0A0U2W7E1_9BACL|nr:MULTISPECIES: XdhC family protein [Paenibacillus]ALS22366.1 XdhC Rossmann domain-containing protein [Paenibacillus naphthalenovorans]
MARLYCSQQVSYIGFLGPKSRTERILHEIVKIDSTRLESLRDVIYSPIGLDFGAETAEEVAVSIAAELLAVRNRRSPQFLRDKPGAIHDNRLAASEERRNPGTAAGASMRPICGI